MTLRHELVSFPKEKEGIAGRHNVGVLITGDFHAEIIVSHGVAIPHILPRSRVQQLVAQGVTISTFHLFFVHLILYIQPSRPPFVVVTLLIEDDHIFRKILKIGHSMKSRRLRMTSSLKVNSYSSNTFLSRRADLSDMLFYSWIIVFFVFFYFQFSIFNFYIRGH